MTSIYNKVMGQPLASANQDQQKVGPFLGVPLLGLDALASAAYGPEAALTILLPLGAAGLAYIGPIVGAILVLLAAVYFSYRQTIAAYPGGGGSYTVARENLGETFGLVAGASLILDYVLNVAVAISSGVGALISVAPGLNHFVLPLCLVILLAIVIANLRGVRESGRTFMVPTYLFVLSLGAVLVLGIVKSFSAGGHPIPVVAALPLPVAAGTVSLWLLLRAFASGCTAMTGVEAISNGITSFVEPAVPRARQTLSAICIVLGLLLAGIAYLTQAYGIGAAVPDSSNFQSVISQLVAAIVGRGGAYYVTLGSVITLLCLSANTSFAGLPRLGRLLAVDDYLPHGFAEQGRRLVYTHGILFLAVAAGILLVVFGGVTDRLIPLFAIGALSAFTCSQAGMVVHWMRHTVAQRRRLSMAINASGAILTAVALTIVLATKFAEGAWIVVLLIPAFVLLLKTVKRHYVYVNQHVACSKPIDLAGLKPPVVLVLMSRWSSIAQKALRYGLSLSSDVVAGHIDGCNIEAADLKDNWEAYAVQPSRDAGLAEPVLRSVESPYRRFFAPVLELVKQVEADYPGRDIAVIVPELVGSRWYDYFLHNQRTTALKALLLMHPDQRLSVISVPWYLKRPS